MASPRRLPYERALEQLLATYAQAQRTIIAQIEAAVAGGQLDTARARRRQLAAVLDTLGQLGHATDPEARRIVADAHRQSARATQRLIGAQLAHDADQAFNSVAIDAVKSLQDALLDDLAAGRARVGRHVDDVFRRAQLRATMPALLGASGSRRRASADIVRQLQQQGQTAFVDRAGRRWSLEAYAQMAARTVTRQAVVDGARARMLSQGLTLARISHHGSSCPICAPWDGRLVSLDGSGGEYEGETVTDIGSLPSGGPPMHPNCRHTIVPVSTLIDSIKAELGGGGPSKPGPGAPAPSPAPVPPAARVPVSQIVTVRSTAIRSHVEHATAAIDRVHRSAGMPAVPVKRLRKGSALGEYHLGARDIAIRAPADGGEYPELTTAHEIGHLLDHVELGGGYLASREGDPRLKAWRTAVDASSAVRTLQEHLRRPGQGASEYFLTYLLRAEELFARSYSQWIATRSGDKLMLEQIREIIHRERSPSQWDDDDFAAIAAAFDDLFSP